MLLFIYNYHKIIGGGGRPNLMESQIMQDINSLPPLSSTITKLQSISLEKDTSIKEVVYIVQEDPFLSADIIKSANSPIYGFSHKITSVTQAISLFGIVTIKGLAISSVIRSSFEIDLEPYKLDTEQFIKTSLTKSKFMLQWYKHEIKKLEILMPTSLLMHMGMVIISEYIKKLGKAKEFKALIDEDHFLNRELQIAGNTQYEILELLFSHWNFEETMVETMRFLYSNDVPDSLKQYVYPLRVLNTIITPYKIATQEQIAECIDLIEEYELDIALFNEALVKIQNMDLGNA
ncbi:HDOD domain-containing protein [Helicobacter ibis]|uniref:HDOD domain-containing protein n=1 Tax=Helicobacter ibis TaxID=2962633 RepID=A0ABT4VES6_9HELI|nr:HDOD domain-containing protein [Helicobacter ibis]MDA3969194.1 HDOD domain-containing protein [Helicobacter ibis]